MLSLLPLARKAMATRLCSVIFASSPPYSILVTAALLKKVSGAKLVLDFRDPWAENPMVDGNHLKKRLHAVMERWVVRAADALIANTPELESVLASKYPNHKIVTITNGYDDKDFPLTPPPPANDQTLTIVHTGEFYPTIRNPSRFMIAIGEMLQRGMIEEPTVKVRFIGGGELTHEKEYTEITRRYGLERVIDTLDFIPHGKAIEEMMGADVLLLMQNSHQARLQIPAKAFEYLYLRKPILLLAPIGATAALIDQTDAGLIVDPNDINAMQRCLLHLIEMKNQGRLATRFRFNGVESYNRKSLTGKLNDLLSSL